MNVDERNCLLEEQDYYANDLNACGAIKKSAEECQKLCQDTNSCVQFTWAKKTDKCCLKNAVNSNPVPLADHISGPKSCGMCFIEFNSYDSLYLCMNNVLYVYIYTSIYIRICISVYRF